MGGSVEVTSKPNKGSIFSITFMNLAKIKKQSHENISQISVAEDWRQISLRIPASPAILSQDRKFDYSASHQVDLNRKRGGRRRAFSP